MNQEPLMCISGKLRVKLEKAGELIKTVKNIGYKLGDNENV